MHLQSSENEEEEDISGLSEDSMDDPNFNIDEAKELSSSESDHSDVMKSKHQQSGEVLDSIQDRIGQMDIDGGDGDNSDNELPDLPYTSVIQNSRNKEFNVSIVPSLEAGGTDKDSDDPDNPSGMSDHLPRRLLSGEASVSLVKYKDKVHKNQVKRRTVRKHIQLEESDDEQLSVNDTTPVMDKECLSGEGDGLDGSQDDLDGSQEEDVATPNLVVIPPAKRLSRGQGRNKQGSGRGRNKQGRGPGLGGQRRGSEEVPVDSSWTKVDSGLVGSKIPAWEQVNIPAENMVKFSACNTPLDFYKLFSTDDWINYVVEQSKLYAVQKGMEKKLSLLTPDTLRCLEGMFLHTGYHEVPSRRMVWEANLDCHNALVADNMRRDTADNWIQFLHVRDNTQLDGDKYYKVRPIFDILNRGKSMFEGLEKGSYSVDEIMIPYFGKHSTKQYIRGKPVRYGYKVISNILKYIPKFDCKIMIPSQCFYLDLISGMGPMYQ